MIININKRSRWYISLKSESNLFFPMQILSPVPVQHMSRNVKKPNNQELFQNFFQNRGILGHDGKIGRSIFKIFSGKIMTRL